MRNLYDHNQTRYYGLKWKTWKTIFTVLILTVLLVSIAMQARAEVQPDGYVSPLPMFAEDPVEKVHLVSDTQEKQEIIAYIYKVFGKDADKAFKVLSCENSSLNPNEVNTAGNYPVGSRDIGIFQVNEYWQGVRGKFLFNWKVNVEIAHQIFKENGSFERWTCGRRFGI